MSRYFDSLERRGRSVATVRAPQGEPAPPSVPVPAPLPVPVPVAVPTQLRPARPVAAPAELAALRERLLTLATDKPYKTLVFAGCSGGEGCTQVVREFAETLARSGLKVLVIDADPRVPGIPAGRNAGGVEFTEAVRMRGVLPATDLGKGQLTVAPRLTSVLDKERFFSSPEFAGWLEAQRGNYDYVLLDVPPLLRFGDATLMGRLSDGVIIVVQADATESGALVRARDQLERARVRVIGAVLNRARNTIPALLRPYLSGD